MSTIAWIDPRSDIIDSVMEPLRRAGHEIFKVASVGEASRRLSEIRAADVIITELIVNGVLTGGYLTSDFMRQLLGHPHPPIIVFSTRIPEEGQETRRQLRDMGVNEVVRNPIRPSELKEVVEKVLETALRNQPH